jgi:effector-binding domain-containing protein
LSWWQGALGELHAIVSARGLESGGPSGGLFASELFQYDRGEEIVFIPVLCPVRPVGRVVPIAVPGAELAVVAHLGALTDVDVTYGELGSYVTTHEIGVEGPFASTTCAGRMRR